MRRFDAVIAGAGAAGMFCAVQLGWRGKSVAVIEHRGCQGRKLMITGKGRCNVTNNCTADTVMKNIPRNSKFMYSALSRFAPEDVMSFFECLGVELKTERGNRVFPVSDNAKDIVKALVKACEDSGVQFIDDEVKELIIKDGRAEGFKCEHGDYYGDSVIVATGGKSYPRTGSTGDGYRLAKSVGHKVTAITPSLCPVVTYEREECASAMGLSLRNCTLTLREEDRDKPLFHELGDRLRRIIDHTAAAYNVKADFDYNELVPNVNNPPELVQWLRNGPMKEVYGAENILPCTPSMGGEDFACYMAQTPGVFVWFGSGNPEKGIRFSWHNPAFNVDDESLIYGAALYAQVALDWLAETAG